MLAPLDQEKIALSRFSVSWVSVFGTWGLSIPTIWGLGLGFYIASRKGVPALPQGDKSCCLIETALRFGQGQQLSRSANELGLQNFLTKPVKELWRQESGQPKFWKAAMLTTIPPTPAHHISFVHKSRQETSQGWPSNVLVVETLEAMWCVNETCRVTHRESEVLIRSSEAHHTVYDAIRFLSLIQVSSLYWLSSYQEVPQALMKDVGRDG
jgi:hypothetical protein